jgi:hypothetical protein
MSDFIFRLNLDKVFDQRVFQSMTEEERFGALAELIDRRLTAMVSTMEDRNYIFEAGTTEALSRKFEQFAEAIDTSCYPFSLLWEELCDWGESLVEVGRREKSLCYIPTLPSEFGC